MFRKIAEGYKKLFSTAGKIILLALVCLASAFVFVFPLWKWALASPEGYSVFLLIVAALFAIYLIYRNIRKNGIRKFLTGFLKLAVIAAGIFFCIYFVLNQKRISALVSLAVTFAVYGILAFGIKQKAVKGEQ